MADTGEKIYLASEETAQEILSSLSSIATNNSFSEFNTIFENGLVVKSENSVKQWKLGEMYYSTYNGGAYPSIEFTGSGIAHFSSSVDSGSNFCDTSVKLTIDGKLMTTPNAGIHQVQAMFSSHANFSCEFTTSIKIECVDSHLVYFVGLY